MSSIEDNDENNAHYYYQRDTVRAAGVYDEYDEYYDFHRWRIPLHLVEQVSTDTESNMVIRPQIINFPRNFVTINITPKSKPWQEILLDVKEFNRLMENYP